MPALDNDPDKDGKPSDHLIAVMEPINNINNNPARTFKSVTFRPLPKSGIEQMGRWITNHKFEEVYEANSAHEKAEILQNILKTNLDKFLPVKTVKMRVLWLLWDYTVSQKYMVSQNCQLYRFSTNCTVSQRLSAICAKT